ncbi:MAG: hypothetical protein R3E12_12420 [Candidatus Eisenbacteria bacterium]
MKAKHLFILLDTFTQDEEVIGSGLGLATRGLRILLHRLSRLAQSRSTEDPARSYRRRPIREVLRPVSESRRDLHHHHGIVFQLSGGVGHIASLICDYLDSRSDLGIDCGQLDKLVLMSCVGSDSLKEKFTDPETLKGDEQARAKAGSLVTWVSGGDQAVGQRQEYLDGLTVLQEKSPDDFVGSALTGPGATMVQLACALDRRGAHPKIAAWDSGIYGRNDGKKSIRNDPMNPILRHQRLINKVMIQFSRPSSSSGGSIRQLGLQEWSDKPLNLPK